MENADFLPRVIRYKACKEHKEALPCSICEYEEFRDDGIIRSYAAQKEQPDGK
jgi:hypothetical protein